MAEVQKVQLYLKSTVNGASNYPTKYLSLSHRVFVIQLRIDKRIANIPFLWNPKVSCGYVSKSDLLQHQDSKVAGAGVEQAGGKVGRCTVHRQVACSCISQLRSSLGNQNQETWDLFSRNNISTYLDVERRSQVLSSFGTCAKNWLAQATGHLYECSGVFQCSTSVSNNFIVVIYKMTLKNNLRSWQFRQDISAEFSG